MRPTFSCFNAVALASLCATTQGFGVTCKSFQFQVQVTGNNLKISDDFDPNNSTSIDAFVKKALNTGQATNQGRTAITASLAISARFCAPAEFKNLGSIQILVHGNTCDGNIWDGLGQHSLRERGYSYQQYLGAAGYATVALDMPGHGNSSVEDPNTVVQMPLEAAIITTIADSLRSEQNPIGIAFSKIVFVGHSYGSVTGVAAARLNPNFADALVLTGWSSSLPLPSPLLALQMHSGAILFDRFKDLPFGYLSASNETGHEDVFYGGFYDGDLPKHSFELQSVMTCGEGATIGEGLMPAAAYKGRVLVITGSNDILFCHPSNGACDGQLAGSTALLPNAAVFKTHVIPNTGHNFMLHSSRLNSFRLITQFIQGLD